MVRFQIDVSRIAAKVAAKLAGEESLCCIAGCGRMTGEYVCPDCFTEFRGAARVVKKMCHRLDERYEVLKTAAEAFLADEPETEARTQADAINNKAKVGDYDLCLTAVEDAKYALEKAEREAREKAEWEDWKRAAAPKVIAILIRDFPKGKFDLSRYEKDPIMIDISGIGKKKVPEKMLVALMHKAKDQRRDDLLAKVTNPIMKGHATTVGNGLSRCSKMDAAERVANGTTGASYSAGDGDDGAEDE